MSEQMPLVLVDGSSYLFRAYHALPPLTNSKGQATGAVKGVINMIRALVKQQPHCCIAVVFDAKGKTFRDDIYPEYKATRQAMPEPLAQQVAKLQVNSTSCTATFTQLAGVAALTGDQAPVQAMVEEFRRRRDVIVRGLQAIPGVRCAWPPGAFYAFPNVSGTGYSARALADRLLDEAGVACLAGTAFGALGEGHLRFSYATSMENIQEALRRIKGWIER